MNTTSVETHRSEWYRTVDGATRAAIQRLHDLRPIYNFWVILSFVALWAMTAWVMLQYPNWFVWIAGYAVIGAAAHGFAVMMHEAVHSNLTRRPKLDRWLGFLIGLPAMAPFTPYKLQHLAHHRYTRTENDPDEIRNFSNKRALLSIAFYLWLIGGTLWYFFAYVPFSAWRLAKPAHRRDIAIEYAIMTVLYGSIVAVAIKFGFFMSLIHFWFIPILVATFYGNVRGWAEHMLTIPGHPLTETRTVTSNPILCYLNLNLNYHLEHHLFPAMPWYNLPKLHALLLNDYRRAGAFIYRSYLKFLWDAFIIGVHGLAPKRNVSATVSA